MCVPAPAKFLKKPSPRLMRWGMNWYPPIRGTGVKIKHISSDWRHWRMVLPLNWRTRNYVGTTFGGSLYAAADPQLMIAWMQILGRDFIVWDKAGKVRFRRPGRGRLHMEFTISVQEIQEVKLALAKQPRLDREYHLQWLDADGEVVAEVEKTVHFQVKAGS